MKLAILVLALLVVAQAANPMPRRINKANCVLKSTAAATANQITINGQFYFTRQADDVTRVDYSVVGLPFGQHTFHVHSWGDIFTSNGNAVGGHFIGTTGNQRTCSLKEVGALGNCMILDQTANDGSVVQGWFNDSLAKLNGPDSIVGRGMIIHGLNGVSGTRIAQCVIGRADDQATELASPWVMDRPLITKAKAWIEGTTGNNIWGFVEFVWMPTGGIQVKAMVAGLKMGAHPWHVHQAGDISSGNGQSEFGHFIGNITGAPANRVEVAQLGGPTSGTGYQLMALNNTRNPLYTITRAQFVDPLIAFNGENSIIGRSIVIHDPSGTRVAHGVIGITQETPPTYTADANPTVPKVMRAGAVLRATTNNAEPGLYGNVEFMINPAGTSMSVRWFVFGLSPGNHSWHVHLYGNIGTANDGSSESGHFIGNGAVRPTGMPQEVGLLNDGVPMVADANGFSHGEVTDMYVRLNGLNGIIGRSVVIHGKAGSSSARVARGVIGRTWEDYSSLTGAENVYVTEAICHVEPTSKTPGATSPMGWFKFTPNDNMGQLPASIKVTYDLKGLPVGNHGFHIHTLGEIIGYDDANAVQGHFIGTGPVRPQSKPQEIGLLNDGAPLVADSTGAAAGTFDDTQIRLYGVNNIVGRSLVIHGDGTDSTIRIAQCVVGMSAEGPVPMPPADMSSSTGLSAAPAQRSVLPAFLVAVFAGVVALLAAARKA